MDIEKAKQIPLEIIVEKYGGRFAYEKNGELWYYSVFRPDESTASFKINKKTNIFKDFGHHLPGGNIFALLADILNIPRSALERNAPNGKEAWKRIFDEIRSFDNSIATYEPRAKRVKESRTPSERYKLINEPSEIWMKSLKDELKRRGISMFVGDKYLQQAYVRDTETDKKHNGFCMKNDKDGLEISFLNWKNCIGHKAPSSFFRGSWETIVVFESKWDFMTWQEINNAAVKDEQIIMHGTGMTTMTAEFIISKKDTVKNVVIFQQNDEAGENSTNTLCELLEPHDFRVGTVNHFYEGFKDLNEAWMSKDWRSKFLEKPVKKIYYDTAWNHLKRNDKPKF